MTQIRTGVVGVGNCFAGLVQGIEFYKAHPGEELIGLLYEEMGGYSIFDIRFTSAFDVGKNKIGRTLGEAIYQPPNLVDWVPKVKGYRTVVRESPILDGVGTYVKEGFKPISQTKSVGRLRSEIIKEIEDTKTEILLSYLPVGSKKATRFWADASLRTGCAFINCMPEFIASSNYWQRRYDSNKVPIIGDDIKSQIGATIVHRTLARLCDMRGIKIDQTYQLNVGGNTDFLNMLQRSRLESKKVSKTEAVTSQLSHEIPPDKIHIGPSDFVPQLGNTKIAFISIKGKNFAGREISIEVRLSVDDKANSAGIAVDAIRCAKIALDRKEGGPVYPACAYYMKHPPKKVARFSDEQDLVELKHWLNNF